MSLADYTSVKEAIASTWLHRSDLTSVAGDFISLFESDFNGTMRVRMMEQETTLTSTSGYLTHPTNWLGWKEIKGTQSGVAYHLQPVTDEVAVQSTAGESGSSRSYKVKGSRTYLYPNTGGTFTVTYYEGVALTSGTNWLLSAFPGAYLYGGLLQATAYTGDDPRIPMWQQAYQLVLDRIREADRKSAWSGQALMPNHVVRVV